MSSCSSNNMEEDAWLMKIKMKQDEPTDALKGDKGKKATMDPPLVAARDLLAEEEEEDILKNLPSSSYSHWDWGFSRHWNSSHAE